MTEKYGSNFGLEKKKSKDGSKVKKSSATSDDPKVLTSRDLFGLFISRSLGH